MPFLNHTELQEFGFRSLGRNVRVSTRAAIYNPELISLGDNSRIDDFCVVAGNVTLGRNVHIAVFCNLAGGKAGIHMDDFSGLAYGCHIIAQSDDYSGNTMTNPTVPMEYKSEVVAPVKIGRHAILGTTSVVLPGVEIGEGAASGAGTIFNRSVEPWTIYVGAPARKIKARKRALLQFEDRYIASETD